VQCPNHANPVPFVNEEGNIDDVDWQYPSNPDPRYPVCDYYLEAIINAEEGNGWVGAESFLSWALTKLRLHKPGHLWGTLHTVNNTAHPGIQTGINDINESMRRRHNQPPSQGITVRRTNFSITEPEIEPLKQFVNVLGDAPTTSFGVAIRRFNQAFDRDIPEDRAVDLFIALESLLSEDSDAIRYKIALRGSHLIGVSREEKISVNSFLKKAYDHRSGIMHGTSRPVGWLRERYEGGPSNLDNLEDIVRKLIRYMSERAAQGQILNAGNIDEALFFRQGYGS